MSSASSVSVVICAYSERRWNELQAAVNSVSARAQTVPALETIVVIDHNDGLLARARSGLDDGSPAVVVVENSGPVGLSAARNEGIRTARGDVVAFLDDDARADPTWIEELAGGFRSEDVIGVGGWVEPLWEESKPRWLAPEMYWIVGCSYTGLPPAGAAIRNGIGANMAFRRERLLILRGFREGLGQTHTSELRDDETELGIRARVRWPDAVILHVPSARAEHLVPHERATWRYLISRAWGEGRGKAVLAGHAGTSAALSSERAYVVRVLPVGVLRGLRDALRGDLAGLGRAASIVVALTATVAGYLRGRLRTG